MNKKYQVLKRLPKSHFTPSFEREFDDLDTANQFAAICNKSEDGWFYYVVEVL